MTTFGDGIDWTKEAQRAAAHDAVGGPRTCPMLQHIMEALGPLPDCPPRVIDCGCNIGQFYPMFGESGFAYVGLDQSAEALAIAEKRWPVGRFIHAFLWDDWLAGPAGAYAPFDVAICNAVLQHNTHSEKERILPRIAAAVRVDGLFAIQESTVLRETRTQLRQEQWIAMVERFGFKLLKTWHRNELDIEDGYLFRRV